MRIKKVRIENFRCLEDISVNFDRVTTLIGTNGSGKSSILRALNWFFNGSDALALDDEDIFAGAEQQRIRVEVEFHDLTERDREKLGKYAPAGKETTTVWRTWEDGQDKVSGKALAYKAFEDIRDSENATELRKKYNELRAADESLNLPSVSSAQAAQDAMDEWEEQNTERLEDAEVSDTNFFGFVGQGKMSGLFDFIFVSADMRADEETSDQKSAILGKILERTVDRTTADVALEVLAENMKDEQNKIYAENFSEQLSVLSQNLTKEVSAFTTNRSVVVHPKEVRVQPQKAQFRVRVNDSQQNVDTEVVRQGHGFQRALLIAALKMLSEHGRSEEEQGTICLVIEEPELFQHPIQAKTFASILRLLAEDKDQSTQIAYATHSPYFIEARKFHQIRRLKRDDAGKVTVSQATVDDVIQELDGFIGEELIRRQIDGVCLGKLPLALFSEKTLLTEGDTDAGVFEGCSRRTNAKRLDVNGIVTASAGGKAELFLPRAILMMLGIPCYVVFDGDKGYEERARRKSKDETDIRNEVRNLSSQNKKLLKYLGATEQNWPATSAQPSYAVFEDTLEPELGNWQGWSTKKQELIDAGLGYSKKDSLTYRDASIQCEVDPPSMFKDILTNLHAL